MSVFNLTVTTTSDQDIALADLAVAANGTPQTVLQGWVATLLANAVVQQTAIDLQKLQGNPLEVLETLAGQVQKG